MPFWLSERSTCTHCGQVLRQGDDVFQLPPVWLPVWEPMSNFREAAFHRACWVAWPHRQRFIERVNNTESGYRFADDESWTFIGKQK